MERHGVVANMAPLGTRPSAKVLKATARPEAMDLSTRSGPVRRSEVLQMEDSEADHTPTPEALAPSPARELSPSSKGENTEQTSPQTPPPRPSSSQQQASQHQQKPSPAP